MPRIVPLPTGADARLTGKSDRMVVCVDGGGSREEDGTWSATLEWLVSRLARQLPDIGFLEVRYRVKSWRRLDSCTADGAAALALAVSEGASRVALLGFSMGGAVAIALAEDPTVSTVLGLAPWIPDRLDVSPLDGKRLAILHGQLDGYFPGVPGVSRRHTIRGLDRIRARGVATSYTLVRGGVHGLAVRAPWGRVIPLPRARRFATYVQEELERFGDVTRTESAAGSSAPRSGS